MIVDEHPAVSERLVDPADVAWERESVESLIAHIVQDQHAYTRAALDRIGELGTKLLTAHGAEYPWMSELLGYVAALDLDLRPHMTKEEHVLFPYIERLSSATVAGRRPEVSAFGTIENPVRMMMRDHDHCGAILKDIRAVTSKFAITPDAPPGLSALFAMLAELERNLLVHIHLETDVLFPRALALEGSR